jgi:hypothetical protein
LPALAPEAEAPKQKKKARAPGLQRLVEMFIFFVDEMD